GSDQGGREYPGVSLEIRELAPDLIDDYLAFFDNDAFADFPWWSACYCRFWDDPSDPEGDSSPQYRDRYRVLVADLIRKGSQQGLLAYHDGTVRLVQREGTTRIHHAASHRQSACRGRGAGRTDRLLTTTPARSTCTGRPASACIDSSSGSRSCGSGSDAKAARGNPR